MAFKFTKEIARSLNIDESLLFDLNSDPSDWAFIVKAHAVAEAAITHALEVNWAKPKQKEYIQKNIRNASRKAEFARCIGILSENVLNEFDWVNDFRNNLVHDVKNLRFTFSKHFDDKKNRKSYLQIFARRFNRSIEIRGRKISRAKFLLENPRIGIWFWVMDVLDYVYLEKEEVKNREMSAALVQTLLERRNRASY